MPVSSTALPRRRPGSLKTPLSGCIIRTASASETPRCPEAVRAPSCTCWTVWFSAPPKASSTPILDREVKNSTAYTMAVIFNCISECESDLMVDPYLNSLLTPQERG